MHEVLQSSGRVLGEHLLPIRLLLFLVHFLLRQAPRPLAKKRDWLKGLECLGELAV